MNKDDPKFPKSTPANKKVFDVMRPGKSPASATSRPVIVGHKPQVQDDQFVPGANSRFASENPFEKHELLDHEGSVAQHEDKTFAESITKPTNKEPKKLDAAKPTPLLPETTEDDTVVTDTTKDGNLDELVFDETPMPDDDTPTKAVEPASKVNADPSNPLSTEDLIASEAPEKPISPEAVAVEQMAEKPETPTEELPPQNPLPTLEPESVDEPMSHDQVVAATGAPVIDHAFVSHHKGHTKWWEWVLVFLLIIIIGLVALNFLLDADVVSFNIDLPHTNLLK